MLLSGVSAAPGPPARGPWGRPGRVLSVVGNGILFPAKSKKEKQYNMTGLRATSLS